MVLYSDCLDSGKDSIRDRENGNSRSVSIAHTQPAAPKLERGVATLARALDKTNVNSFTPMQKDMLGDGKGAYEAYL